MTVMLGIFFKLELETTSFLTAILFFFKGKFPYAFKIPQFCKLSKLFQTFE